LDWKWWKNTHGNLAKTNLSKNLTKIVSCNEWQAVCVNWWGICM